MDQVALTLLTTTKDAIVWVLDQLDAFEEAEELCLTEIPIYKDALESCKNSIETLHTAFSEYYDNRHELVISKVKVVHINIKYLTYTVEKLTTWYINYLAIKKTTYTYVFNCLQKVAYAAVTLPKDISNELRERKVELLPIITQLLDVERETIGSAMKITHPVLRKAWMMCGRNDIEGSRVPISVLADNVLQLFLDEKNVSPHTLSNLEYELQSGVVMVFLKRLDGALQKHGEADGYLTPMELNNAETLVNIGNSARVAREYPNMPVHAMLGVTPGVLQCMIDPVNVDVSTEGAKFFCELKCMSPHTFPAYYGKSIAVDYVEMICLVAGTGCIEYAKKLPGHWRWSKREVAIIVGGQQIIIGGRPYVTYKDNHGVVHMLPDVSQGPDKDEKDDENLYKIRTHKVYADEKTPENTVIRYFLKGPIVCSFIAFQQTFKFIG